VKEPPLSRFAARHDMAFLAKKWVLRLISLLWIATKPNFYKLIQGDSNSPKAGMLSANSLKTA
jgi:hypothetical protein